MIRTAACILPGLTSSLAVLTRSLADPPLGVTTAPGGLPELAGLEEEKAAGSIVREEERVMNFVMAYGPPIRARRNPTDRFIPASRNRRLMEHTGLFTGFPAGGTGFPNEPLTVLAGARLSIPPASPEERREFAEKRMSEAKEIDPGREQPAADRAELRRYEADPEALRIRYEYLKDRSDWAQERVAQGYDTADNLWDIAQKLTTERSGEVKLNSRIRSKRLKIAHYAGRQWPALLAYLQGRSELEAPRVASRFELPAVE